MIGITGTKGKTTVVELLKFILEKSGQKTTALSSINSTSNTMPGRFFIQRFLRRAVDSGCKYALIEVTSEGVKLGRHRFINWDGAVFINLHPEHIESHGSFEKYREAKVSFFEYVRDCHVGPKDFGPPRNDRDRHCERLEGAKQSLFFINKDDENSNYFIKAAGGEEKVISFSKSDLPSNLIGEFNKYNVGAAVAVAKLLGINDEIIKQAVAEFSGVSGRMEFIQKEPFAVVVDYAHTPDSLREVYKTLRSEFGNSKLICVLGSAGGGRDKWKRPEMGKIAAEYCDKIILTNEDPYNENPETILDEIVSGFSKSQIPNPKSQKILDRKEAIKKAIDLAQSKDVVVITGKGSEKYIHIANGKKISWSDRKVVIDILK